MASISCTLSVFRKRSDAAACIEALQSRADLRGMYEITDSDGCHALKYQLEIPMTDAAEQRRDERMRFVQGFWYACK